LTPWFILLAPPGVSPSVVALLNREVREVLAMPEVQERLLKIGIEAESSTALEASTYFMAHRAKMNTLLEQLQISIKN
jgi:tripartite-type tricarboxylate transporter receptor subunit TctC